MIEQKTFNWKQKMLICKKCESLSKSNVCNECGCIVYLKAVIPNQKCPLNKW